MVADEVLPWTVRSQLLDTEQTRCLDSLREQAPAAVVAESGSGDKGREE